MAAGVQHNFRQISVLVGRIGPDAERELDREHTRQLQLIARTMRREAPKYQSVLTNSVHVASRGHLDALVRPGADYALARETGQAPGKWLPRFHDPAAGGIIRWLESKAFAGMKAPRRTSMAALRRNLELRDRYQGLAWHVHHRGLKADPFVRRTFVAHQVSTPAALIAAAKRGIAGGGSA